MSRDKYVKTFGARDTETLQFWENQVKESRKKPNTTKIIFDPRISYESYLKEFRADFQKKWKNISESLSTGLAGFTEIATLGVGSFGSVKLMRKNTNGEMFATKVIAKRKLFSAKHVETIFNEKRVLSSIRFPNHTNLEFSRKDDNCLYLGMTLAGGGELFEYHRRLGAFNEKQARFYAAQIFLALEYLHFLNLIYRDLKPENICFDQNGYIKLTDYGFTKYVPNRTSTLCGTPEYLAPEVIKVQPYGVSADWWAFGVLLYEFVAGNSPFAMHASNTMLMYDKICSADYKMPSNFTLAFKNLLRRLLQPNLSKRIGVCNNGNCDIKRHRWFKKINWYAILNQEVEPPYVPQSRVFQKINYKPNVLSQKKSKKSPTSDVFDKF